MEGCYNSHKTDLQLKYVQCLEVKRKITILITILSYYPLSENLEEFFHI